MIAPPVAKPDLATLAAGHTIFVRLEVSDAAGAPVSDNFYWWAADEASYRELNSLAACYAIGFGHVRSGKWRARGDDADQEYGLGGGADDQTHACKTPQRGNASCPPITATTTFRFCRARNAP